MQKRSIEVLERWENPIAPILHHSNITRIHSWLVVCMKLAERIKSLFRDDKPEHLRRGELGRVGNKKGN